MNFASPHGIVFVPDKNAPPQAQVNSIKTFGSPPNGVSGLDSITIAGKYVFVEYGNNVNSTGAIPGTSTIIQYDKAGNLVHAYAIEGSVDGLKYNPETKMVWALQNQDGRSSLSLIDPTTQKVTAHFDYANTSTTRGYDDVVFDGKNVFLSYTNPTGNGDPTIVKLLERPGPEAGPVAPNNPRAARRRDGLRHRHRQDGIGPTDRSELAQARRQWRSDLLQRCRWLHHRHPESRHRQAGDRLHPDPGNSGSARSAMPASTT